MALQMGPEFGCDGQAMNQSLDAGHSEEGHDLGRGSILSLWQSLNSLIALSASSELFPTRRFGRFTPDNARIQFFLFILGLAVLKFQWTPSWGELEGGL